MNDKQQSALMVTPSVALRQQQQQRSTTHHQLISTTTQSSSSSSSLFVIPLVQSLIKQMIVLPLGDPILRIIYSIVKRKTRNLQPTASSNTQTKDDDPLVNYKMGLMVFAVYYAFVVTYKFYQGYHRNLTHLFEPFAPLRLMSSGGGGSASSGGGLQVMIQDWITQLKKLVNLQ